MARQSLGEADSGPLHFLPGLLDNNESPACLLRVSGCQAFAIGLCSAAVDHRVCEKCVWLPSRVIRRLEECR